MPSFIYLTIQKRDKYNIFIIYINLYFSSKNKIKYLMKLCKKNKNKTGAKTQSKLLKY